jgi:hypothetical protein
MKLPVYSNALPFPSHLKNLQHLDYLKIKSFIVFLVKDLVLLNGESNDKRWKKGGGEFLPPARHILCLYIGLSQWLAFSNV